MLPDTNKALDVQVELRFRYQQHECPSIKASPRASDHTKTANRFKEEEWANLEAVAAVISHRFVSWSAPRYVCITRPMGSTTDGLLEQGTRAV